MTTPFRRVLCPVDFSEISSRALAIGVRVARAFEASLLALHVIDTRFTYFGNLVALPDLLAENRERAGRELERLRTRMGLGPNEVALAEGVPHREIVGKARDEGFDLIVMGTHGASGFERLFLGSVTEKVLHETRSSLMAVPPLAGDGADWKAATVLAAVDFVEGAEATVRAAAAFADRFGGRLLAVHVVSLPDRRLGERARPLLGTEEARRWKDELVRDATARLEALVPSSLREAGRAESRVVEGEPYRELRRLAEETPVDLVVMGHGSDGLAGLGSIAHKMIRSSPAPVLVARAS